MWSSIVPDCSILSLLITAKLRENASVLSFLDTMTTSLPGQSICPRVHGMQIISAVALSTVASGASDKQELAGAFHLHVN